MNRTTRSGNNICLLTICMLTFVLAVASSPAAAAAAEVQNRGPIPDVQQDDRPEIPPVGENEGALSTRPQPSPTTAPSLSVDLRFDPSAPNRIVFHAATPVQLCKAGDGLQVFFIGKRRSNPSRPLAPPLQRTRRTLL